MKNIEYIRNLLDECDKHAAKLEKTIDLNSAFFPLNELSLSHLGEEQQFTLDVMVYRFSRLQDTMGAKLFREILVQLGAYEPGMSYLDVLDRLEKEEYLPNADVWMENIRSLRNHLTNEYPSQPEVLVEYLNHVPEVGRELLNIWRFMRPKVEGLIGAKI